jgi:Cdc6-like AAA superfamily ATPase
MIPKNIRKIPNPYFTTSSKLSSIEFVGRTEQVAKLHMILDDYQRTSNLQNIFISGEKSIGKSCLLNKYRQILQHYNFAVFETELQRNANIPIEEFEFFKVFFDELFEKYAPPEDNFFNEQQCEIWFSLTRDNYFHESDFQQRALSFPTQYANRKKGIEEVLSYKLLERDFEKILNELISKKMEFEGLAILIDEFQELSKSTLILDFLRQLSENLPGLIVIGAGLPTFYEEPVFEKFNRISLPVQLRNMGGGEIIDMIFKPMERLASRPRQKSFLEVEETRFTSRFSVGKCSSTIKMMHLQNCSK